MRRLQLRPFYDRLRLKRGNFFMFFRLSKNSIKNAVFDPFGGGYPPSPLNSLYIASAYDFIRKLSFFHIFKKKNILSFSFFFFWGGRGWVGAAGGSHPRARRGVDSRLADVGGETNDENCSYSILSFCLYECDQLSYPPKCPDEEHTTCSGGTDTEECATARLAQGSGGVRNSTTLVNHHFTYFNFS